MSIRIVTVSREFGSGGRTIAKKIAENLGYDYYDKELVAQIARESGLAEQFVIDQGEYASSRVSFLFDLSIGMISANGDSALSDKLYIVQHNIIRKLANQKPCVIVGRCADHILADRDDVLNIFCHADLAHRADRIVNLYGETDVKPEKRLKEKDDKRRVYYRHYTGKEWGRLENYHLCLDTGKIGIDQSAEIVTQIVKNS